MDGLGIDVGDGGCSIGLSKSATEGCCTMVMPVDVALSCVTFLVVYEFKLDVGILDSHKAEGITTTITKSRSISWRALFLPCRVRTACILCDPDATASLIEDKVISSASDLLCLWTELAGVLTDNESSS